MDMRQNWILNAYELIDFLGSGNSSIELFELLSSWVLLSSKPLSYKKTRNDTY